MSDDPPFLPVGTEISAKFKGAFCEAKVKKVVRSVKCKVTFKDAQGGSAVLDESAIKGVIRVGALLPVLHPDTKQLVTAIIQNIKDCSTYTVVFDDGDEKVLRRTQMCLKGGKHFHASESLDVMPLTKPEQFGAPVLGRRRRARRKRTLGASAAPDVASESTSGSDDDRGGDMDESGSGAESETKRSRIKPTSSAFYGGSSQSSDYGRVVCVHEHGNPSESRRWFPALIVSPKMRKNLKINANEEYLVRSFKDGRCLVVQKARVQDFNLSKGKKVDIPSIKPAVEKAILYLEKDELPSHWDRELLLGEREDDDNTADHTSSPGSVESAADDAASPVASPKEQCQSELMQSKEPGSSTLEEKASVKAGRITPSPDPADRATNDSDVEDRQSPEVGFGTSKDQGNTSVEKQPQASPGAQSSGITHRRLSAIAKRQAQQSQQPRRKGGGASSSSSSISSETKDRFVAQLYKFMEERGTPINKAPILAGKELDLYLFYDTVKKLGGYNRVCHKAEWKTVIKRMKLIGTVAAAVKNAYNKYLFSFDSFYRKLGNWAENLEGTSSAGSGRVNRRERQTSKSGTKLTQTREMTPDAPRRQLSCSKTPGIGKEVAAKTQKTAVSVTSTVSKSISSDNIGGSTTPKAPASPRERSKERSASPFVSSHPPIADEDLTVGARVKVQYGSGGNRKLYQAKIVKASPTEGRYVVHYLGWNTRYDESVPKSRIVEILSTSAAASSDSGGSNNDQGENGGTRGGQKIVRSNSRSHHGIEKSHWRRRRSSGGSTHSLPLITNDEIAASSSARKSSSISATSWRKTELAGMAADDDGDESGKESAALLSSYKPKPLTVQTSAVEVVTQTVSMKRPASANATSDVCERTEESVSSSERGPPTKRGRRAIHGGGPSSTAKRRRSVDESDDESETRSNAGAAARRVSKRLRGVKASIEEELNKRVDSAKSENEEEKSPANVPVYAEDSENGDKEERTEAEMTVVAETSANPTEPSDSTADVRTAVSCSSRESEEGGEEKDFGSITASRESTEGEGRQNKPEVVSPSLTSIESEKGRENASASSAAASAIGQGGGNRSRAAKMRRRRRNYSQMVTDHKARPSASKTVKKEVGDSDGETGCHMTSSGGGVLSSHGGSRHNEGSSPRDPNSLQALRHRIQVEMDAEPSKFRSHFTFNVIDENLDSERKIQLMQTNIVELKETYLRIRSELSSLEKCRKKILEKQRKQEKRANKPSSRKGTGSDSSKKPGSSSNSKTYPSKEPEAASACPKPELSSCD